MQPGEHLWETPTSTPHLARLRSVPFLPSSGKQNPHPKRICVALGRDLQVLGPLPPPHPDAPHSLCRIPIAEMRHSPVEAAPHQMTLVVVKAADRLLPGLLGFHPRRAAGDEDLMPRDGSWRGGGGRGRLGFGGDGGGGLVLCRSASTAPSQGVCAEPAWVGCPPQGRAATSPGYFGKAKYSCTLCPSPALMGGGGRGRETRCDGCILPAAQLLSRGLCCLAGSCCQE